MPGGGTLTLSRNCAVTLKGSPSFSHRCATRVRTWFSTATLETMARKITKAVIGIKPLNTPPSRTLDQMLAAVSCMIQLRCASPSAGRRRKAGLIARPEYRSTTILRSWGIKSESGASTALRNSKAKGASSEANMNKGKVQGFINASGRYSGS